MPKQKLIIVVSIILALLAANICFAGYPEIQGRRVNDYANVLNQSTKDVLEEKLEAFDSETTNEVVVAIVQNMEGIDIDTYRNELFDKWNLGKADKDNGVLLVVAMDERDVGIEVGYGLEGVLTDSVTGSIIRNEIMPSFKAGNYDEGVTKGVDAIIFAIKGEYIGESKEGGWVWVMIIFLIIGGIFGLIIFSVIRSARRNRYWDSGRKRWVYRSGGFWGTPGGGWSSSGGGGFSGGGGSSGGGGASGGW